jgi:RHS repeat-associated protein
LGIGRLTTVLGQNGNVVRTYDTLGQVSKETKVLDGVAYAVGYAYDRGGNVTQMTYPSGRIVSHSRDSMGRVAAVTTQANAASPVVTLASAATYYPFGPLAGLTYGNGLVLSRAHTRDYRMNVLRVRDPAGGPDLMRRIHAYADGINLTAVTEAALAGRNESYGYSPANRLASAAGAWGTLAYGYDLVGNRSSETRDDGTGPVTGAYNYPATSNRLATVTQGAATVRSLSYDAAGNITADDRAGTVYGYAYNDRGRLTQSRVNGQLRAIYRYDVFERLNSRQLLNMTPAGTTHYVQDLAGHLLVEATSTGTVQREYIWLDDLPLVVVADVDTATPHLYYVHADHLDRPLRMTDGAKAVVWDAVYEPFGQAVSITGPATLNLRFPGQYFLIESGLAYNWHRHYDASLGRYTQPDPVSRVFTTQKSVSDTSKLSNFGDIGFEDQIGSVVVSDPIKKGMEFGGEASEFVDGPSLYGYARSAPTQTVDSSGLVVTGPFTPIPKIFQFCSMDCIDAYFQCLRVRGGAIRGGRICAAARANCERGFPTIFAPGVVGVPR